MLTELRGWVKLIEVSITDRVFDGVEFVTHQGCSYSGYSEVVDVFGITMTLNHKLLIAGIWVGAKDVRTGESARREAIYTYKGDDKYLSEMLTLRGNIGDTRAEFKKAQPSGAQALPALYRGDVPSDDQHPILGYLEGDTEQNQRPNGQKLWWAGYTGVRGMAGLQYFLHRYVRGLLSWLNDRAGRCQRRLLEGQLSLGYQHGTASQQTHQQVLQLSGRDNSPRRALSQDRAWKNGDMCPLSGREVNRRSDTKREELYVRDEPTGYQKKAQVYDLVDCGPRSRFVIRNADGDVFISHNSAGHGLNLQTGGNILVYFSHDWNLEYRMQILERIGPVRQLQAGLDRPVFVYNIIGADTADELVIARTESKREVQDLLLEAVRRRK